MNAKLNPNQSQSNWPKIGSSRPQHESNEPTLWSTLPDIRLNQSARVGSNPTSTNGGQAMPEGARVVECPRCGTPSPGKTLAKDNLHEVWEADQDFTGPHTGACPKTPAKDNFHKVWEADLTDPPIGAGSAQCR